MHVQLVPGFGTFVRRPCSVTRNGGDTDSPASLFRAAMLTTPLTCFFFRHDRRVLIRARFEALGFIVFAHVVIAILLCFSFAIFYARRAQQYNKRLRINIVHVRCRAVIYYTILYYATSLPSFR